jgi:hypothetical protein
VNARRSITRRQAVRRWVHCSWVLSSVAILAFVLLLCRNAGWLPEGTLVPLRVTTVATSAAAGLLGFVVFLVADLRGRTRTAFAVGWLAGVASLPALAVLMHVLFPSD